MVYGNHKTQITIQNEQIIKLKSQFMINKCIVPISQSPNHHSPIPQFSNFSIYQF